VLEKKTARKTIKRATGTAAASFTAKGSTLAFLRIFIRIL
jgi:hypothetical protein